jgi:hypothetical protein
MARRKLAAHVNDIISKYRNGTSAAALAREYQCTTTTVTSQLRKFGVMPHVRRNERHPDSAKDAAEAVRLHNSGIGPIEIGRRFGRSRGWVFDALRDGGCTLRGHTGQQPTREQLLAAAAGREANPDACTRTTENVIADALSSAGYNVSHQMAIDTGNVDLTIPAISVAVEVCCRGTFGLYLSNGWIERRIRQLGECGWHTYVLGTFDTATAVADGIDDMLAWLEFLRRQPTARRQYRVVRRNVDLLACGCSDDKHFPFVASPVDPKESADRRNAG